MKNVPLVSTIIIFFNAEAFIQEAIESVFAQTYKNWELLLVDDGSTDSSAAIALNYTQQYSEKVRYFQHTNHQNLGTGASRNLGVNHSQGEYIAFLDADDVWLPQKLDEQVAILESQPEAAMLYGRIQFWHSWTGKEEDRSRDYFKDLGVQANTLIMPPKLQILSLQKKTKGSTPSSMIFRKSILEKIGGFEECFPRMFEDSAFLAKLHLKAPVFVANNYWVRYRQHENSICRSVLKDSNKLRTDQIIYLNWLKDYLLTEGVKDVRIWIPIYKEIWLSHHPKLFDLWIKTKINIRRFLGDKGYLRP
jgi:glycosyltransferase involved in cell wall biosynthesis